MQIAEVLQAPWTAPESGFHMTPQHVMVSDPAAFIDQPGLINDFNDISIELPSNEVACASFQPADDCDFFPDLVAFPDEQSFALPDLNTELVGPSELSSIDQVAASEPLIVIQDVQVPASHQFTNSCNVLARSVTPMSSRQTSLKRQATVQGTSDGRFRCSSEECSSVYLRAGDCRRHLKKHNGPFHPCEQPGCPMVFYRMDKLRAHMSRGHRVPSPTRASMHRHRRGATPLLRGN